VKRTQLYLDDDLWEALHERARKEGTTLSELVRQATRDRYLGNFEQRRKAMLAIVGIWKDRPEFRDPQKYVRSLRADTRLDRLYRK
jgi:hypothetical protein